MREIIDLNQNWKFIREDVGLPREFPDAWEDVSLPHCWNAVDGMDGNGSFYRGTCWYAKRFKTPVQPLGGGRVFVEVTAAGQQAVVYCNGKEVIRHEGGYSAFRADITSFCSTQSENLLVIACDNSWKSNIYPQQADFTFYGGLYRGVKLICVPDAHFELLHYAGSGIKVTPKPCSCGGAQMEIETWVCGADANYTVLYSITDANGKEVGGACRPACDTKCTLYVPKAHLWDVDDPYLYTVTARLERRNETCDEVSTRAGVRSFSVDPQKGFFLNERSLPLRGVSRHQDRLYKGNALSREDHYEDAKIIKELGANTIRLAHYQHSEDFYDACDELGFIVWAEIPFISVMSKDPAAHDNCVSQMKELITQAYNHPCICFWGISNEILIGGISEQLVENHKKLNAMVKEMDPTRLTTIAHVSSTPVKSPMHHITDVISYNHYFGWYQKTIEDNGPWLDEFHAMYPDLCLGMSEYGCEGIITYHSATPARGDYSEEYQSLYHEGLAKAFDERSWLWSTHVWNMFDFGCAARREGGVAGRNNKGLVTMDRKTRKDSFYIYQAYWTKEPMVHIAGRRYAQRAQEVTEVKVYSNQNRVSLYVNGKLLENQAGYRVFKFMVPLDEGNNMLVADTGVVQDSIVLERVAQEPEIYVLPEFRDHAQAVANWFTQTGSMDLDAPMEFPEGKYSIKDSMEELSKCPGAWEIAAKAALLTLGREIGPDKGMWDFVKKRSFFDFYELGRFSEMPKGFAESLNAQLNQFSKSE